MDLKPEVMQKLLAQSDERLWEVIRKVGAMNHVSLPTNPPPAVEMQKLRQLLQSGKLSYDQAMQLLANYRKGETP